ncbi:hypothetical protein CORC01_12505 [Colletotrichum orchidophilum]|uniref:Uncharacterized protein n=1 Tax=Colletotrichum orchidophilum TaxID=1209926 RepID=A0A1G4ASY1_9PEZI|nr:uncharacterized protein CORC01_12505 [Colletotrichum orchidophilum]OHE92211.1 hypothetical protein CORC01_12505 [Colletotrichum orchidophilum]
MSWSHWLFVHSLSGTLLNCYTAARRGPGWILNFGSTQVAGFPFTKLRSRLRALIDGIHARHEISDG